MDLHGPAINAYTYPFFTCSIQYLFQNIFPHPEYMHLKCIIQRSGDRKQRFNPPICNMYLYIQLCSIFTLRGDIIIFYIKGSLLTLNVKSFYIKG